MKLIILLAFSLPACAAPRHWVAACIAGGADIATSAWAIRQGARELNPVFGRADGSMRWGLAVPVKAATCVPLIGSAFGWRVNSRPWRAVAWTLTAVTGGLVVNNVRVGSIAQDRKK